MSERLNKRGFFKKAGLIGGLIAVEGVNEAYGHRILQPRHELNPDVMFLLGLQADIIASHISFRNFEQSRELGASGYIIKPKASGFAQMILAMAYYEDGQEGVGKIMKGISERNLEITLGQTPLPAAGVEKNIPGKPYQIVLTPEYLLRNIPLLQHEMYHVYQNIRDGWVKAASINGTITYGALAQFYLLLDSVLNDSRASNITASINTENTDTNVAVNYDEEESLNRRRFFKKAFDIAVRFGATAGFFIQYQQLLVPYENQAHIQTDGNHNTVVTDPSFNFDSWNLFDFEKAK